MENQKIRVTGTQGNLATTFYHKETLSMKSQQSEIITH